MMKRFLMIVLMGLLWCNISLAFTTAPLSERTGKESDIYNFWIKDYNKFKKEFNSEVVAFCANQLIKGAGAQQLLDQAKCEYRAAVDLANKYTIHVDPMRNILYRWHQTVFPMAKATAIATLRCRTSSCDNRVIDDYVTKSWDLRIRLFKNLDREIQEKASRENAEYYAKKKKKKKEEGPNIDDNEILAAASGTGFFVTKAGHLVTNHHVVEACNAVKVNFKNRETETVIIAVDKANDLAIIKANITPNKIFPVSDKDVSLLQDIIIAGFPLGKDISAAIKTHKGSVTALAGFNDNYSNFQTDATINQGNSGGPIMNQKGNIVGVAVATWVEEGVQGVHFGIKSSTLKTFAKANGIKFLSPNYREMSNADLGKLITEATVFVECWMTKAKIKKMIADAKNKKAFYSKHK